MKKRKAFKNCCNAKINYFNRNFNKRVKKKRNFNEFSDGDDFVSDNYYVKKRSGRLSKQSDSKSNSFNRKNSDAFSECKLCHQTNWIKHDGPLVTSNKEKDLKKIKELCTYQIIDEKPQFKLTQYSVYDKAGHLCSFDGTLIQDNIPLFFMGYVKPIYDENPGTNGGFPCNHMGPITQWWVAGYDGGEKAIVGISSDSGDYYLMNPSASYSPFMKNINEKIFLTKLVIDFLQESDDDVTYENLIHKLMITVPPSTLSNLKEKNLLTHAEFIYDQILSYDSTADPDDKLLLNSSSIQSLIKKAKISVNERLKKTYKNRRSIWRKKEIKFSKATTTFLVENVFESFFQDQMNKSLNNSDMFAQCVVKLTRLENLGYNVKHYFTNLNNDSIIINNLLEKKKLVNEKVIRNLSIHIERLSNEILNKFLKKKTKKRGRSKSFILNNDYENDEEYIPHAKIKRLNGNSYYSGSDSNCYESQRFHNKIIRWLGKPNKEIDEKIYYNSVIIDNILINKGDFVSIFDTLFIAQIKYMWENDNGKKFLHAHWFIRSTDTILGEVGNPKELFLSDMCQDVNLNKVIEIVNVTLLPIMSNWNVIGNFCLSEWNLQSKTNNGKFFYQKRYNSKYARFEDLEKQISRYLTDCWNCEKLQNQKEKEIPSTDEKMVYNKNIKKYVLKMIRWRDEEYFPRSCVFLTPGTIMKLQTQVKENQESVEDYDENLYPEKYRKNKERNYQEDEISTDPFDIGYIQEIYSVSEDIKSISDVYIKLKKLFRPQNTNLKINLVNQMDLNLLYWSDEDAVVNLKHVQGKCFIAYEKNLKCSTSQWFNEGQYRFYFNEAYDSKLKTFHKPTSVALNLGKIKNDSDIPKKYPTISRPLRSLDVFAGCGGLTQGFHQAGVAECLWAIEKDASAAHAFRLNYPKAAVFTEDCNQLLNLIINGQTTVFGQNLPKKGEVELLCGGPPCQGYSGMNRYNKGQCSQFNNSLIVSFLSYCDYYRPRFFILENVRNFVRHGNSSVLKLTLNCLIKMGYQVTFGVLQSGHFGIPQSRRRVIILAAAPGEILPQFPEPFNTFVTQSTHLQVTVNDQKYITNLIWLSAPFRMITVYDAISDLPVIKSGDQTEERSYNQKAKTHFQRMMRETDESIPLRDHICKHMSSLVEERISRIPRKSGADWRDLPNIAIQLNNGSYTKKLKYTHHDIKNGKSSMGAMRGVCCCASKIKCKPQFRQSDTIIPWCLPHTANRHGQWSGLYGRLGWDDYFRTVVTNPEPMGKQGRVLHPEQNRVFSVRECARSQGFPDSYKFFGTILDKYRQIGNAVAPPFAKAIGMEIKKSVSIVESVENIL